MTNLPAYTANTQKTTYITRDENYADAGACQSSETAAVVTTPLGGNDHNNNNANDRVTKRLSNKNRCKNNAGRRRV